MGRSRRIRAMRFALVVLALATSLVPPLSGLVGLGVARAGDNLWTWLGMTGDFGLLIGHPVHTGIAYARVQQNRVYKTSDAGATWVQLTIPGDAQVHHIGLAPSDPDVVYLAVEPYAVYRSNDGGGTWTMAYDGYGAVSVSPADWREAYLARGEVLLKTVDGGASWDDLSGALPDACKPMNGALFIAPSAPNVAITPGSGYFMSRPCKTVDGGRSWTVLMNAPMDINDIAFDPTNSNTMYVGTNSPGGWKTIDGGASWFPLANGLQPRVSRMVIDPNNTQVIHAANGDAGVLESTDGGASWTAINEGIEGLWVGSIAIASRSPLSILATVRDTGIWAMTRTAVQDYSISVNDGALYTNQTDVTLTLTAPPGTQQMIVSNDGGFAGAVWEPFAESKLWTITAYGEHVIPRVVYAKFQAGGQISGLYQDDIVLDVTAPSGSVEVTQGGSAVLARPAALRPAQAGDSPGGICLPLMLSAGHPGYTRMELLLSATDDVSGVGEMLLGGDSAFTGSAWEPFSSSRAWWVSGSGTTTIYARFRDRAGNESAVYTATSTP